MIKDFKDSILSFKDYSKFGEKSIARTIVYILLLSFIFGFFIAGGIESKYRDFLILIPENYNSKVPDFNVKGGEMQWEGNYSVVISDKDTAIIFDKDRSSGDNRLSEYKKGILIVKEGIIIKSSKSSIIEKSWRELQFDNLNKEEFRGYLGLIPSFMLIFIGITMVLLFISNIIIALFLALIFRIAASLKKRNIKYLSIFKMAVYSETIPMVLMLAASLILGNIIKITQYYYVYYISGIFMIITLYKPERTEPQAKSSPNKMQRQAKVKNGRAKK